MLSKSGKISWKHLSCLEAKRSNVKIKVIFMSKVTHTLARLTQIGNIDIETDNNNNKFIQQIPDNSN